jgi:hypothetical protein
VRYRYDVERQRRLKTVELIVAEVPWQRRRRKPHPDQVVGVRTRWGEVDVGRALRRAGGIWNRENGVWQIAYARAIGLGLADRIVDLPPCRQSSPPHSSAPEKTQRTQPPDQ